MAIHWIGTGFFVPSARGGLDLQILVCVRLLAA